MKNLITALNKARAEIPAIKKDGKSHHGKYATLDNVVQVITPILSQHGLVIVQTFDDDILVTSIWHESGEAIHSRLHLPIVQNKNVAQGLGISITYSRRYAIGALLSLSIEDDTDGNHAPQAHTATQPNATSKEQRALSKLKGEAEACKNLDSVVELINRWEKAKLDTVTHEQGKKFLNEAFKRWQK